MISLKTHGKLYIAGEYQVLNSGGNAIIFGLNRYIYFNISSSNHYSYTSRDETHLFSYRNLEFTFPNNNKIANEAIKIAFKYLSNNNKKVNPFSLNIKSELEDNNGKKYGFGSSSAVISGIIKAILLFHQVNVTNDLIFKLSVIAQVNANALTSGGDLAAALYGGYIYYERYDLEFVLKHINDDNLVNLKWPKLLIESLNVKDINVMAIWTNESYQTKPLNKEITKKLYKYANRVVKVLRVGLEGNNFALINKAINAYDIWLQEILKDSNRYIESFSIIKNIANMYGLSSKLSGAGGGDSAIVLYDKEKESNLMQLFSHRGFETFTFK